MNNRSEKPKIVDGLEDNKDASKPSLYSSIVQTESKLRQITISHLEPQPVSNRASTSEVNFSLTQQVYDYANMVDVGLNSGEKTIKKPKSKGFPLSRQPEPKLSDYYQPSFDNVQRIQLNGVENVPELTVQYNGIGMSTLLSQFDDLTIR